MSKTNWLDEPGETPCDRGDHYPRLPQQTMPVRLPSTAYEGDCSMKFFDSWGGLWEICGCDDAGAVAFGPGGCARKVDGPTYPEAAASGLVRTEGEWLVISDV